MSKSTTDYQKSNISGLMGKCKIFEFIKFIKQYMKIVKENPNQVDITNEPKILELLKEKLK